MTSRPKRHVVALLISADTAGEATAIRYRRHRTR